MKHGDIKEALKTLAKMAELEIAIADFYAACGQQWADEMQIWSNLSAMEIQHARNIRKVADAVREKPNEFKVVKFVNPKALGAVIERIRNYADRVRQGSLTKKDAITVAQDTESSVLEMLFTGVFEAETPEYRRLIESITTETGEHKSYFDSKVKEIKSPASADAAKASANATTDGGKD